MLATRDFVSLYTSPESLVPSPVVPCMKIAIGSTTSESKIRATESVCARAFSNATAVPVPVASGGPPQPTSDEETIRGALDRAREARRLADAELGIGSEGGVHRDLPR